MNTQEIIQLGNPKLRLISEPVPEIEFETEKLQRLVKSLYVIMRKADGIGLAAPQLGINLRLFVFGYESQKYGISIPDTVLINPTIEFLSQEMEDDYESCLSVGPLQGKVSRYSHLGYRGFTENGILIEREVKGLHARVVQHEYDHLDGTIFLDRVKDPTTLGYPEEIYKTRKLSPEALEKYV